MNKTYSIFYLSSLRKFLFCTKPISAYQYYRDFRIDLLTGIKETYKLSKFLNQLDLLKVTYNSKTPLVIHLFYELRTSGESQDLPANKPLALAIEYSSYSINSELQTIEAYEENEENEETHSNQIHLEAKEYPNYKDYKKKFDRVYKHLLDGDCYQVNLTSQFFFKFSRELRPEDFINQLWKEKESIGAYAHCTYVHSLDKLFLSNSPECLFQIKHRKSRMDLITMPIKGTAKINHVRAIPKAWLELCRSKKEQAELYMISDLLRNDLAKIESGEAKILKKKLPLIVPGIVHQYSLVQTSLKGEISLLQILKSIFPGGSITGAPKKRVMQLISKIEDNDRGFYCGSTIIFHKSLKAASINIRSAEVDFSTQEMQYGSGGGVTLMSEKRAEFDETYIKMKSFVGPLGNLSSL
jgi:para-aminobenzoate synthetase component 1